MELTDKIKQLGRNFLERDIYPSDDKFERSLKKFDSVLKAVLWAGLLYLVCDLSYNYLANQKNKAYTEPVKIESNIQYNLDK